MSKQSDPSRRQPTQEGKSRVGMTLERWAAQPIARINRRSVVWTGLAMLLLVSASGHDPGQVAFVRNIAMVLIGVHGALHVVILQLLHHLKEKGVPEAQRALTAYLAPRRVTNLDLAIAWGALTALVALFRAAFPVVAG